MRLALALLACLALAACANADGSRPRLSADAPATSFNGAYAGATSGFGDPNTRSAPF